MLIFYHLETLRHSQHEKSRKIEGHATRNMRNSAKSQTFSFSIFLRLLFYILQILEPFNHFIDLCKENYIPDEQWTFRRNFLL